tara:strand:+ start:110 stop:313 length:204 start_codon:yes stop_codon:yes gene_type:complete
MSILNYFFIGVGLTFLFDLLFSMEDIRKHPKIVKENWGMKERVICALIWPLAALVFLISFIKQFFIK